MPNTLVTGANGFLAAHIIDQLISAGHKVTGSVRSVSKGEQILATHSEYEGKLNFVVVSEYAKQGTWDEAFKEGEFDFVVHTAAPLLDDPGNTNFERDFLNPSVGGALELLKSASKYGKKIKAISVTGSVNSMTTGMDIADRSFNSSEWLPVSVDDAIKANHSYISYCVAKAESEKAIWKYVEEHLKKINYSTDVLYSLFNGTYETVPDTSFPSYIDVRDLAAAHILALTLPTVANKRFLVGGNKYSSQIAVDALKTLPELKDRLPKDGHEAEKPLRMDDVLGWNEKLGLKPRTALQTFGDAARRLLELEKSLK
ncbi:uncharacterized protein RSE6_11891 [Rhynchosporium secalis]|uniref:NAD-dependent epimerase/dehydratase domain-containing protein n=1 Tax=Rhynchosporium secalis TaxID=38038 RepID=A0A1E1MP56_RHYSE|nr:uncharacterized protein RSE6_11891 [Rhynchosporium secalis]